MASVLKTIFIMYYLLSLRIKYSCKRNEYLDICLYCWLGYFCLYLHRRVTVYLFPYYLLSPYEKVTIFSTPHGDRHLNSLSHKCFHHSFNIITFHC